MRYAADLFPQQKRRYIWFTDIGLASGIVQPQLAQDPRLSKKPLSVAGVRPCRRRNNFQGDGDAVGRPHRSVDYAHSAAAQLRLNLVSGNIRHSSLRRRRRAEPFLAWGHARRFGRRVKR